ncbi:hypothetical protein VKT23_013980 [Stygiomarasmius scandens]|uniref:Uncharacterized protein n=1 Tax=Marasmiellus scandens TaxID=2682957 RepID=A0ABR1J1N6_9AGAR
MVRSWVLLFILLFFLSKLVYAFSISNLPSAVGINQHFTISWARDDSDPKNWHFVKKSTFIGAGLLPSLTIEVPDPDQRSGQEDGFFIAAGTFTMNAVSLEPPFNTFFTSNQIKVKFGPQNLKNQDNGSSASTGNGKQADGNGDDNNSSTNDNADTGGSDTTQPASSPSLSSGDPSSSVVSEVISSTQPKVEPTTRTDFSASSPSSTANTIATATDFNDTSSSSFTSVADSSSENSSEATVTSPTGTLPSTTQPAANQQSDGQAPSERPAIIAASIIGAIIFVSLLVFFYLLYNRRRKRLLAQRERMMESFSFERDMEELRESAFRGIDRSGNDGGLGAGGAFMVPGISVLGSSNAMNAQEGRGGLNGRWKSLKSSISRTFTLTTISSGPVTGSMFYGSRRGSPGSETDESWRRNSYFPSS